MLHKVGSRFDVNSVSYTGLAPHVVTYFLIICAFFEELYFYEVFNCQICRVSVILYKFVGERNESICTNYKRKRFWDT